MFKSVSCLSSVVYSPAFWVELWFGLDEALHRWLVGFRVREPTSPGVETRGKKPCNNPDP